MNGEKVEDYCTDPTTKHTFHGDQWVTAEIECKDGVFRHFVKKIILNKDDDLDLNKKQI